MARDRHAVMSQGQLIHFTSDPYRTSECKDWGSIKWPVTTEDQNACKGGGKLRPLSRKPYAFVTSGTVIVWTYNVAQRPCTKGLVSACGTIGREWKF